MLLSYLGDVDEALDQIDQALRINPFGSDLIFETQGVCKYLQNSFSEAIDAFKNMQVDTRISLFYAAACHKRLGNSEEAGEKLQKKLSKWKSVRRWEKDPDFVGGLSSDDPVDPADIDKYIMRVCEEETIKAYDRSKKGLAIRKLDAQREEAENALYSGGSMQAVRQYINSVFTQAGIADNVAKNLLLLSQK